MHNQYPLPLITALIRDLGGADIYTKLDVRWGYNNVRIKEGDEHKAAFKTRRGLYEPTVMFFGLTNSPATFQSMMNALYRETIQKHEVRGTMIRIYMDDIAIATKSPSLSPYRRSIRCAPSRRGELAVFQTIDEYLPRPRNRLPGGYSGEEGDEDGPGQGVRGAQLAHPYLC